MKIATMEDVREYAEGYPVELWRNREGRVIIRAFNECGNNVTEVDLYDLLEWLSRGQRRMMVLDNGEGSPSATPLAPRPRRLWGG
jgi:hypothetical protein